MKQFLKNIKVWILDILYPKLELPPDIHINQTLFCPICRARQANNKKICHKFAQYQLGAATTYDHEAIRKMIWRLKYRGKTGYAPVLANLLCEYLASLNLKIKNYLIIPVPLSQRRLRERGYNQAALIAKLVAERFQLPFEEGILFRVKDSKAQMEIKGWDERKTNIAGCFGVVDAGILKRKNIILIDDVFTSGSTMNESIRTLRSAGANRILALTVAKAG